MSEEHNRLDQVFIIFQQAFMEVTATDIDEPLASEDAPGVDAPVRAFTISVASQPFAIFGLTDPTVSHELSSFVTYIARRALARNAPYLILSNQSKTILAETPHRDIDKPKVLCTYPTITLITSDPFVPISPLERIALVQLSEKVVSDLKRLYRDGRLDMVLPDADFFVNRLTHAVAILKPAITQALDTKLATDLNFAKELEHWATTQGIPADLRSRDFTEAVVRQSIYRLLGKVIFYQSLRRAVPILPEMNVTGLDTSQVQQRLNDCFVAAHEIDYHAVFRQDVIDRLPFPAEASTELRDLIIDLNTRDFAYLPQDVVGAVFERLIPPEDRHALGQFFTPEDLVDLILAFCVHHSEDKVLDPTCGTGTFLIRAYDQKRIFLGLRDHNQQLNQLWGIDIAPFPAELATINLFRQQVGEPGNFPGILNDDFFNVRPGGTYRFPPLKIDSSEEGLDKWGPGAMIDEPIPVFDAIVGNFPYINAANIEKSQKGYLADVNRCLTIDWLEDYPDGFVFKKTAHKKEHQLAHEKSLDITPFIDKAKPIISTYADLYVSLFWHAAAFLKPGGRMGIVTSNAWLDVNYGYALQRFFLDNFKIISILESRCEPWFTQAAVNTVVTIVEHCQSQEEPDKHPVRFVKIKRPLAELIPWDMHTDSLNRWIGLNKISQRIESYSECSELPHNPKTFENDDFRVRLIRQGVLRKQIDTTGKTVKWGPYLRVPQVYFDLISKYGDKLIPLRDIAPPKRGGTTRINEFFYLDDETINKWDIDIEFCLPLIKSPGETDTILINPKDQRLKVFVCHKSKDQLKNAGQYGTLNYIEWGEQQEYKSGVQGGMKWPDGPWVKNRKPGWYALPKSETHYSQLFFAKGYGDRYIQKYSPSPLIADNRLYYLSIDNMNPEVLAATMNSFVSALFTELSGRLTLGDGALELSVEDARDYLIVPDINKYDTSAPLAVQDAFQSLLPRSVGSVFDEVQKSDRHALDSSVLEAMGLDPDEWLPRIYDGLTTLVRERTLLGKMRSQTRRSRSQKAVSRVSEEVLQDLLPNGPKRFPEEFLSQRANAGSFKVIPIPKLPLHMLGPMMGRIDLGTENGEIIQFANKFEARYVLYAQANDHREAKLPEEPVEVSRAVNNYVIYLRELRSSLYKDYHIRTLDQAAATRFVTDVWRKYKLPDPEG